MDLLLADFHNAYLQGDGYLLSRTISPVESSSQPNRLQALSKSANSATQSRAMFRSALVYKSTTNLPAEEANAWVDIYVAYYEAIAEILKAEEAEKQGLQASYIKVYEAWKNMTNQLIRGYNNGGFEAWTIPCLYVAGKYMRVFGIKADEELGNNNGFTSNNFEDDLNADAGKNDKLEDAARVLNRIFQLCLADRAPIEESRKWGIYYIINLLFKTYFKLNSVSLSKNIMRALAATSTDMPELSAFPKSHQVTFKYYVGVINFLEENYVQAEKDLTEAWDMCHRGSTRNKELILTYLIPCHLLTTHTLPTNALLDPYPRLQTLFLPLSHCIKRGDLSGFDAALRAGEDEFVKRRIYLTLERGRDIALRNLLRKVFVAGGFEPAKEQGKPAVRRTRISVNEFAAAISLGTNEAVDSDEVECLLANMIYKGYMKGYIARDRGVVVVSKSGAFPGTGV